jgi:hypothetical protein
VVVVHSRQTIARADVTGRSRRRAAVPGERSAGGRW